MGYLLWESSLMLASWGLGPLSMSRALWRVGSMQLLGGCLPPTLYVRFAVCHGWCLDAPAPVTGGLDRKIDAASQLPGSFDDLGDSVHLDSPGLPRLYGLEIVHHQRELAIASLDVSKLQSPRQSGTADKGDVSVELKTNRRDVWLQRGGNRSDAGEALALEVSLLCVAEHFSTSSPDNALGSRCPRRPTPALSSRGEQREPRAAEAACWTDGHGAAAFA